MVGRSLGGAVATHLISDPKCESESVFKGVVIENTFTGISDMADALFPFLKAIPAIKKRMLKLNWDSHSKV